MWHRIKAMTQAVNSNIVRYYLEAEFALAQYNMTSRTALLLPHIRPLTSIIHTYLHSTKLHKHVMHEFVFLDEAILFKLSTVAITTHISL
jgi:hypothetical protein